jgi:hypothetical protein
VCGLPAAWARMTAATAEEPASTAGGMAAVAPPATRSRSRRPVVRDGRPWRTRSRWPRRRPSRGLRRASAFVDGRWAVGPPWSVAALQGARVIAGVGGRGGMAGWRPAEALRPVAIDYTAEPASPPYPRGGARWGEPRGDGGRRPCGRRRSMVAPRTRGCIAAGPVAEVNLNWLFRQRVSIVAAPAPPRRVPGGVARRGWHLSRIDPVPLLRCAAFPPPRQNRQGRLRVADLPHV